MDLWLYFDRFPEAGNRATVTKVPELCTPQQEKIIIKWSWKQKKAVYSFVIAFIHLSSEVSVPRSLKVSELWTLQSGIKEIQWYHRRVDNSGMCQSYVFGE